MISVTFPIPVLAPIIIVVPPVAPPAAAALGPAAGVGAGLGLGAGLGAGLGLGARLTVLLDMPIKPLAHLLQVVATPEIPFSVFLGVAIAVMLLVPSPMALA